MKQYLKLLQHIQAKGVDKSDRTGTGTRSVFGYQMRFDLQEGFPLLTTKKLHLRSIIYELLWFLRGDTTLKYLIDNGVHIWDEWAKPGTETWGEALSVSQRVHVAERRGLKSKLEEFLAGLDNPEDGDAVSRWLDEHRIQTHELLDAELGPVYGSQWRKWLGVGEPYADSLRLASVVEVDQIAILIETLRTNPDSRRMIVSAWNPSEVDLMALPPCHCLFQFYTRPLSLDQRLSWFQSHGDAYDDAHHNLYLYQGPDLVALLDRNKVPARILDCQLYQRSVDTFLGLPFNIASYSLLTMMIAQCANMVAGELVWTGGDVHLYRNHFEQAGVQMLREPLRLPRMQLNSNVTEIGEFKFEDFTLLDYKAHPHIPAPISV